MKKDAVLRTLAAVGGLALMAGFIGWMSTRDRDPRTLRYWEKRLPQSLTEAKVAGIWTSFEEINEEVPQGVNGAAALAAIYEDFKASGLDRSSFFSWASMYAEDRDRLKLEADLAKFKPFRSRVVAAFEGDYFAWPPTPGDPFPDQRSWRVVHAYVNATTVSALKGDSKELRPSFRAASRLSQALVNSGYSEGVRRGIMMRQSSFQKLLTLAESSKVSDADIRELTGLFRQDSVSLRHGLRYSFCGPFRRDDERAHYGGMPWYGFLLAEPAIVAEWQYYFRAPWPAVERAGYSGSLHYWATMWPEMAKPLPIIAHMVDRPAVASKGDQWWPIEDVLDTGLPEFAGRLVREDARGAVTSAAIEIELHRRRHGTYPASLPKSGNIFVDPWNGKALNYRKVGPHYLVWSVGANGIDERGQDRGSTPQGDDIAYSSERRMASW